MSDTAEYWFNKNSKPIYMGPAFYHIPNEKIDCGHRKHHTTPYINDINCHACKKLISEGYKEGLIEGDSPETYYMSIKEKKNHNRQKRFNELHGKCECGSIWVIRKNSKTNTEFLACLQYPKCRKTKSILENKVLP